MRVAFVGEGPTRPPPPTLSEGSRLARRARFAPSLCESRGAADCLLVAALQREWSARLFRRRARFAEMPYSQLQLPTTPVGHDFVVKRVTLASRCGVKALSFFLPVMSTLSTFHFCGTPCMSLFLGVSNLDNPSAKSEHNYSSAQLGSIPIPHPRKEFRRRFRKEW